MPYLVIRRDDIPNQAIQALDLWPNTSKRISGMPAGQTKYLRKLDTATVVLTSTGSARTVHSSVDGLAAYLVANIEDQGGAKRALTPVEADAAVGNLLARTAAGLKLEAGDVNAAIVDAAGAGTVNAGTTLTAGNSTGTLADVLSLLAGATYRVDAGTGVQDAAGAFVAASYGIGFVEGTYRITLNTDSLRSSFILGEMKVYTSSSFVYNEVAGAAVVVYNDDGTLYTGA